MTKFFLLLTFVCASHVLLAEEFGHGGGKAPPRVMMEPRSKGIPQHGSWHNINRAGAKPYVRKFILIAVRTPKLFATPTSFVSITSVGILSAIGITGTVIGVFTGV